MSHPFDNLHTFIAALERQGDMQRVTAEVNPVYEMAEIAGRQVKAEAPVLFFERVTGSPHPVVLNVLASDRRIELALGRHPQQVGAELKTLLEAVQPPTLESLWSIRGSTSRVLSMRPKRVVAAPVQSTQLTPDLRTLPIMHCWPGDAGRFVTFGLVMTVDPVTGGRNTGVYRMQLAGTDRLGMHWQIQKGGGFHYHHAEQLHQPLETAVVIGADPVTLIAAVSPLPEGIDELAFAGFLRGKPVPMVRGKRVSFDVPAEAQMIIEGIVPPIVRMDEGPFGDHFGHYSHQSPFPVFQAQTITQRAHPIYLSAVVGKPPQEDKYIGNAVQEITIPLLKVIHPELRDFWAHYEAGFHSLGVVSVEERYAKEGMKTALGLFGTGQMSLTKCLVVVDEDVNVRDMSAVLAALRAYFNPAEDFLLLPGVPFDTLDFTSMTLNVGSKMVLDATSKSTPQPLVDIQVTRDDLRSVDTRITSVHVLNNALVLVQVDGEGRSIIEQLVRHPRLQAARLVAVVSPDVDLDDRESWMWGLFTRFDPARDVIFADTTLQGSWPVYRGVMGIDATFKPGYPAPVEMHDEIVELVDRRWKEYQL